MKEGRQSIAEDIAARIDKFAMEHQLGRGKGHSREKVVNDSSIRRQLTINVRA